MHHEALGMAVLAGLLAGCSPAPIEPAPETEFLSEYWLRGIEEDELLTAEIEISVGSGRLAEVGFVPAVDCPQYFAGRRVQKPEAWPVSLTIYPRGSSADAKDAIRGPCHLFDYYEPIKNPRGKWLKQRIPRPFVRRPFIGTMSTWWESGLKAIPEAEPEWKVSDFRFWTYVTIGDGEPGDYVYEVTIFPTSFWLSDVRFDTGPPVVLQRGLLRVTPAGDVTEG